MFRNVLCIVAVWNLLLILHCQGSGRNGQEVYRTVINRLFQFCGSNRDITEDMVKALGSSSNEFVIELAKKTKKGSTLDLKGFSDMLTLGKAKLLGKALELLKNNKGLIFTKQGLSETFGVNVADYLSLCLNDKLINGNAVDPVDMATFLYNKRLDTLSMDGASNAAMLSQPVAKSRNSVSRLFSRQC